MRALGRLPVVARRDPRRLLDYLGRTALLEAWLHRVEEHVRESGVVAAGLRVLKRKLGRKVPEEDASPDPSVVKG
jgi:hypothetical protein